MDADSAGLGSCSARCSHLFAPWSGADGAWRHVPLPAWLGSDAFVPEQPPPRNKQPFDITTRLGLWFTRAKIRCEEPLIVEWVFDGGRAVAVGRVCWGSHDRGSRVNRSRICRVRVGHID